MTLASLSRSIIFASLLAVASACIQQQPAPEAPFDAGTPRLCVGGVITADGGCAAKCDPSKCLPGNTCVGNACMLKCTAHPQCDPFTQRCEPAFEDDTDAGVSVCAPVPMGILGASCPIGNECPEPAVCHGTGPADVNAYCTRDCTSDAECPGGYECGYKRDPHAICGTKKGNNGFCGKTSDPCVDPASLVDGGAFVEGEFCLLRRVCLKRDSCASCASDLDCSSFPNQTCLRMGTEQRCATSCLTTTDCEADKHCVEGSCVPVTGACVSAGFCHPCRYDVDCGAGLACVQLHGNERSCIDMKFSTGCNTSADCPMAPSGRRGVCLNQAHGLEPGDSAFHKCYAPHDAKSNAFSCYYPH